MSNFLEQYCKTLFVLILIVILIAFASPLWKLITNITTKQVSNTEKIGKDEIITTTDEIVRPEESVESVEQIYCIYYNDGEMTISQNKIEPDIDRIVVKKGFYYKPIDCTNKMITVRFVGAVKVKNCNWWFEYCSKLIEIKNIENLYTNECSNIECMFSQCSSLENLDLSTFDTSNVINMRSMFFYCTSLKKITFGDKFTTSNVISMNDMFSSCSSLTSIDLSTFDTSNVTNMEDMFFDCKSLTSLDLSYFNISKVTNMNDMFEYCDSLLTKSIKVSQMTYNKLETERTLGISIDRFHYE